MTKNITGDEFEENVRRVARAVWSDNIYNDRDFIEEKERDVRIETRDRIIFIECTIDETLKKIKGDAEKLRNIISSTQKLTSKLVTGLIVTLKTPTQHQIGEVARYNPSIRITSLEKLQSEIVDGATYLSLRQKYRFGSAQNLRDNSGDVRENDFVEPIFGDVKNSGSIEFSAFLEKIGSIKNSVLLTGEFGVGKSMTCRQIYMDFRKNYLRQRSSVLPIYLNLRDHTGQVDPTEALYRHAKKLGYPRPDELVRAWRSGFCFLILDGFDEMATAGWGLSVSKIRNHRYAGMALIRAFVSETPRRTSILIAGRTNFFDSQREMYAALSMGDSQHLTVDNFNNEQIQKLKYKLGVSAVLPEWLPSRPLLAGYFMLHGFAKESDRAWPISASEGWDKLLTMICAREAQQDDRIDPMVAREILERLSTIARGSRDGLGSFNLNQLHEVFTSITGMVPDEGSQQFIARLPGLQASDLEDGTRKFIDIDFVSALRAGDVIRLIEFPYLNPDNEIIKSFDESYSMISRLTIEFVADKLQDLKYSERKLSSVINSLEDKQLKTAKNEILLACVLSEYTIESISLIDNAEIESIDIHKNSVNFSNIIIKETIVHYLHIDTEADATIAPKFENCIFSQISGARTEVEVGRFAVNSEAIEFVEEGLTSNSLLGSQLPTEVGVLLASLKKLYFQAGAGRRESAFYRGIDPKLRGSVQLSLELLCKHDFAVSAKHRGNEMYFPNRKTSDRVRKIMSDPFGSNEPIVVEMKNT